MPREKFQALTEQMFYILLCLKEECCGMDIMGQITEMTAGRVAVGPGTLYNLLEQFADVGMIRETKAEGRRRSYLITQRGMEALAAEVERMEAMASSQVQQPFCLDSQVMILRRKGSFLEWMGFRSSFCSSSGTSSLMIAT